MTITRTTTITCVLCGVIYDAPLAAAGYGLCPDHYSRDTLREWDRVESARRHIEPGTPGTLILLEWLAIISRYRGLCALCEQVLFSQLTIWSPSAGLTAENVLPTCRACSWHLVHGWNDAIDRVHGHMRQGHT